MVCRWAETSLPEGKSRDGRFRREQVDLKPWGSAASIWKEGPRGHHAVAGSTTFLRPIAQSEEINLALTWFEELKERVPVS